MNAVWRSLPIRTASNSPFTNSSITDKTEYAAFYGRQAAQQCGALIEKWDIDLVLPVPMYAAKQRKRGYNQAELIARELSKKSESDLCFGNPGPYQKNNSNERIK